jgi:hypothetical protein
VLWKYCYRSSTSSFPFICSSGLRFFRLPALFDLVGDQLSSPVIRCAKKHFHAPILRIAASFSVVVLWCRVYLFMGRRSGQQQ